MQKANLCRQHGNCKIERKGARIQTSLTGFLRCTNKLLLVTPKYQNQGNWDCQDSELFKIEISLLVPLSPFPFSSFQRKGKEGKSKRKRKNQRRREMEEGKERKTEMVRGEWEKELPLFSEPLFPFLLSLFILSSYSFFTLFPFLVSFHVSLSLFLFL